MFTTVFSAALDSNENVQKMCRQLQQQDVIPKQSWQVNSRRSSWRTKGQTGQFCLSGYEVVMSAANKRKVSRRQINRIWIIVLVLIVHDKRLRVFVSACVFVNKIINCPCAHTCHTYDGLLQNQANHLQADSLQLLSDLNGEGTWTKIRDSDG